MRLVLSLAVAVALAPLAYAQKIAIGSNVNISVTAGNLNTWHAEIWAAADPNDPNRLLACSVTQHMPAVNPMSSTYYASADGGKTWKQTLEIAEGARHSLDPVCNFGVNHSAFAVAFGIGGTKQPTVPPQMTHQTDQELIYRSTDGGFTWLEPVRLPFADREDIAQDMTGGKYNGNIYLQGIGDRPLLGDSMQTGVWFFRSVDGGRSFQGPISRESVGPRAVNTGNSIVLEDGTVLFSIAVDKTDLHNLGAPQSGEVAVLRSTDGGASLEPMITIAPYAPDILATLAADRSAGPFKHRIYVSWVDYHDGAHVYVAHSDDNATTWSGARRVEDTFSQADLPTDRFERIKAHIVDELARPIVDVNKDGIVGVGWYDARAIPDGRGWDLRMAFSFDGGETFGPSVRVNSASAHFSDSGAVPVGLEAGINFWHPAFADGTRNGITVPISYGMDGGYFYGDPGHTGGMRAGADGIFHAFWVDNRTGISQLYTAPVEVHGDVVRNGSPDLSALAEISDRISLALAHEGFDRGTGVVTFGVRVRNNSKETIHGPLKLRLVELYGDFGHVSATGADNNNSGPGAIWDLTSLLENSALAPGQTSAEKAITFKLADPRSVQIAHKGFGSVLAKPTFRVLAVK